MGTEEEGKQREAVVDHHHQPPPPPPPQYGTFQGVANYPPPQYPPPSQPPVTGFPQPAPPEGAHHHPSSQQPVHGYPTVPGYAVSEGGPPREHRLPCCGIGCGWFLFIIGIFLGAIPWYIGSLVLLCSRIDPREKPGYIACAIAAVLATIVIIFGVTGGTGAF
ncbi:PREDICTED: 60S ribosomal protein L18a-like protein isoform X2 [Tarenaya hassleriana]|uniref:60S ribosomal protein L18a-like protein isoform X2 n=1 Tax=Tarenaya hassleriana TaxID=28532 RepID=UPI00053C6EE9|nr:PREDICTED: 60S ribosomal protein L18a-like protein isoform X2 [Tarenaya hassleriana]